MEAVDLPVDCQLLGFDRETRRKIFYLKADSPFADSQLRALKVRAERELHARTLVVPELARQSGFTGETEPIAVGYHHVVHKITGFQGEAVAVRSTVSDVFSEDRGLLLEKFARVWMGGVGRSELVPETLTVKFKKDGVPFDLSILGFSAWPVLANLGDYVLDDDPRWLFEIGQTMREIHAIDGAGAGLLDVSETDAGLVPTGVHPQWADYVSLNLVKHADICVDACYIEPRQRDRILQLFDHLRAALNDRPRRLLHGDPGTHNICVVPETRRVTTFLDWEDALVGDPLFDVAMVSSFQPERRMQPFMKGYGMEFSRKPEQQLIALYFLRIALSKTVHRLRFGIVDKPGRSPGHHRIYRGLDALERSL